MPATAAHLYLVQREKYRNAINAIASIADAELRQWLTSALTSHVRGKFRGISNGLTRRMGCRLSTLPDGYIGPKHIEHAVPLRLIHDKILGISKQGMADPVSYNRYQDEQEIQEFIQAFVVGVHVTPAQHGMLNPNNMHGEWNWLADLPPWNWDELTSTEWNFSKRPLWLQGMMNRYEHVKPDGPLEYRPIQDDIPLVLMTG